MLALIPRLAIVVTLAAAAFGQDLTVRPKSDPSQEGLPLIAGGAALLLIAIPRTRVRQKK